MRKPFKKFLKQTTIEVRAELARAHLIIALLSLAIIVLLSIGVVQPVSFDPVMSAICIVLLIIVGCFIAATALCSLA